MKFQWSHREQWEILLTICPLFFSLWLIAIIFNCVKLHYIYLRKKKKKKKKKKKNYTAYSNDDFYV